VLTLRRASGQRIFLGLPDGRVMTIVYCGQHNGKGHIGIEAPKDVSILREELLSDEQREAIRP
jgi:sRNA-binding carbon storage regulator CsrA